MIGFLLLSAFWSTSPVQAQTTNVVCASNFNYLNNKEGQNPCLVAAYLQVPCSSQGTNYGVPALGPNQTYVGPSMQDVNYCACSSVVYSLVSACAQCQNHEWVSWSFWHGSCGQNQTTVAQYPLDIPLGTGVPAWAYQNVGLTDFWNYTLALPQVSVGPESTYYGTPTASISYHISTAGDVGTQTGAATASQTGSPSTGSRKSNAGPIAGGVIGGIALLALIGALVWLLVRRRRKQALIPSPVAYYPPGGPQMGQAGDGDYPAAVDYGASYPPTTSPTAFSGSSTPNPPKLYDPSDPSTFPKTPASFGYQSTMITASTTPSNQHDNSTAGGGRYTGIAEI